MNKAVSFDTLATTVMQTSAKAIIGAADFVFRLWPDGEIADASFGPKLAYSPKETGLAGRQISEIASPEAKAMVADMITAARNGRAVAKRMIPHSDLIGTGTAGRYSAHLTADGKNIVMIGTAISAEILQATQTVDAEIARYRQVDRARLEAEYRYLFQRSTVGLLIVNTDTGLIEEANGNAVEILGRDATDLIGQSFQAMIETPGDADELPQQDHAAEHRFLCHTRGTQLPLAVTTQVARGIEWSFMVVRLNRLDEDLGNRRGAPTPSDPAAKMTIELLRKSDIPIAMTDLIGSVVWTNPALEGVTGPVPDGAPSISTLLGIPVRTVEMVLRNADQHGRLLTSLSALESGLARTGDAYVAVIPMPAGQTTGYGFVIHKILAGAAPDSRSSTPSELDRRDALADLVGQAPMKELVRRSTDVIERKCIEAALRLTENNRAAAANVLGLSRQSLYIKLRLHGLL